MTKRPVHHANEAELEYHRFSCGEIRGTYSADWSKVTCTSCLFLHKFESKPKEEVKS